MDEEQREKRKRGSKTIILKGERAIGSPFSSERYAQIFRLWKMVSLFVISFNRFTYDGQHAKPWKQCLPLLHCHIDHDWNLKSATTKKWFEWGQKTKKGVSLGYSSISTVKKLRPTVEVSPYVAEFMRFYTPEQSRDDQWMHEQTIQSQACDSLEKDMTPEEYAEFSQTRPVPDKLSYYKHTMYS